MTDFLETLSIRAEAKQSDWKFGSALRGAKTWDRLVGTTGPAEEDMRPLLSGKDIPERDTG